MENLEKRDVRPGEIGYVQNAKDMPVNAIPLSSNEVIKRQFYIIDRWQPQREMFLMKHGHVVLGGFAALSGFAYVTHLRQMMLLRTRFRFASYGPAMILPLLITSTTQNFFVTRDLSLGITACPVCLEVRSTALQMVSGIVQPFFLAILSTTVAAKLSVSYPLPPLSDYKTFIKIYSRLCRPLMFPTVCLAVMNAACAVVTTFSQFHAVQKVNQKLISEDTYIP